MQPIQSGNEPRQRKTGADRVSTRKCRLKRVKYVALALGGLLFAGIGLSSMETTSSHTNLRSPSGRRLLAEYPDDVLLSRPYENASNKYMLIFHFIGIIYMCAGVAIVCDDYFVEALEEMVRRWGIEEDVAGATFMAAGGSAPEFAISIMGVFVSEDEVGISTIVGSAVFNVLFVIGVCAIFAKETLALTWWPLFRDCFYYVLGLGMLVVFIRDGWIEWYESILLFLLYGIYVLIMKNNGACRRFVSKASSVKLKVRRSSSSASGNKSRHSTEFLKLIAMNRVRAVAVREFFRRGFNNVIHPQNKNEEKASDTPAQPEGQPVTGTDVAEALPALLPQYLRSGKSGADLLSEMTALSEKGSTFRDSLPVVPSGENEGEEEEEEDDDNPFEWPDTKVGQLMFLGTLPLVASLHFTVPKCSRESKRNLFWVTFFMSLIWIIIYTYCMVWWVTVVGEALGISTTIMGVTILAGGTSIPDALSSVIVARRGFGDMAVSSSVGSNIFDILFGLPVPWILKTCIVDPGSRVPIKSDTLVVSVVTLLSMVLLVILSIMFTNWKLNKTLGAIMFFLYIAFIIQTLVLETMRKS